MTLYIQWIITPSRFSPSEVSLGCIVQCCLLYCRPFDCPPPSTTITTGDAGDQHVAQRHHAVDNRHDNGPDGVHDTFEAGPDGVEYSLNLFSMSVGLGRVIEVDHER